MRWSVFLPCKRRDAYSLQWNNEKLKKKQLALEQKEKELLEREKALENKIKQIKNNRNRKARSKKEVEADIKAAKKLRHAKNKLILALDTRERVDKISKKKYKRKSKNHKSLTLRFKSKRKKPSGFSGSLKKSVKLITDFLTNPCTCNCTPRTSPENWRRRVQEINPSCLRKVFGGPCSCPQNRRRELPPAYKRALGFQTCRCEYPNSRNRPTFGAGGDCYLMTLRQTPQLWIHDRWPRLYPHYLSARHEWKNLSHCCLICAAFIFWLPCILCFELCRCCCCACCCE